MGGVVSWYYCQFRLSSQRSDRGQWDDCVGEQRAGLEGWSEAIIGQSKDWNVMEPRWTTDEGCIMIE